jgi:hypothetical protein
MYLAVFFIGTFISALIAGVSFYRYTERDTVIRSVGVLFLISTLCNLAQYAAIFWAIPGVINPIGSLYNFLFIIAVTVLYYRMMVGNYRGFFITASTLTFVWGLIVVFIIQSNGENTSFMSLGNSFMLLIFSVFYFYRLMKELPTVYLHRLPAFWFNSANLIFASGTIFLFASYDYLVRAFIDINTAVWTFKNLLLVIQQIVFLIGLYYDFQRLRTPSSPSSLV